MFHDMLRKNASEIRLEILVFFTFINFLMKTFINQEHNLIADRAFVPFTYLYCENCTSSFSGFFLNLSKSCNILFRSMSNGNFLFSSASLSLVRDYSLVHKLRVMAAVALHVNATYYVQHPALKSFMKKAYQ